MPELGERIRYAPDRKPVRVGCKFWHDCFDNCPYPECIDGKGIRAMAFYREAAAVKLALDGKNPGQIAELLRISRRSVRRYLDKNGLTKVLG